MMWFYLAAYPSMAVAFAYVVGRRGEMGLVPFGLVWPIGFLLLLMLLMLLVAERAERR